MKWFKRILLLLSMPFFFLALTVGGIGVMDTYTVTAEKISVAENQGHKWLEDFMVLTHVPLLEGGASYSPGIIFLKDLSRLKTLYPTARFDLQFDDHWNSEEIAATTKEIYSRMPELESPEKAGYVSFGYSVKESRDGSQDIYISANWNHDRNMHSWYSVKGDMVTPEYVYWEFPGISGIVVLPAALLLTLISYIFFFRRLNRRMRQRELALAGSLRQDGTN